MVTLGHTEDSDSLCGGRYYLVTDTIKVVRFEKCNIHSSWFSDSDPSIVDRTTLYTTYLPSKITCNRVTMQTHCDFRLISFIGISKNIDRICL